MARKVHQPSLMGVLLPGLNSNLLPSINRCYRCRLGELGPFILALKVYEPLIISELSSFQLHVFRSSFRKLISFMSGLEVVGIALGSIPIVLHFVDVYKSSIRRVGTTIWKRKHVEKLARALLLQQQILEETVKSVVLTCGCENVGALEEDPFGYFSNGDVRERVEDYLGPKTVSPSLACSRRIMTSSKKLPRTYQV